MSDTKLFGDLSNVPTLSQIAVEKIIPNPKQPRKYFDKEKLQELADSMKEQGQIQPIVISSTGNDSYIIVAGERR